MEDDPYFFLQQGVYVPKSERISQSALSTFNDAEWLASLDPSYLKLVFFMDDAGGNLIVAQI